MLFRSFMVKAGYTSVSCYSPPIITHSITLLIVPTCLLDIKPDNILVDWANDEEGRPVVQKVALGDFDLALKLIYNEPLRSSYVVGNVMWRSPGGQSGKGIAKASDVFSLGLVVSDFQFVSKTGLT